VTVTDDGAIVLRIERPAPVAAIDELLPLAKWGLPRQAALALVTQGKLTAARVGGRWFARRSDLMSLIDVLAREQAAQDRDKAKPGETVDAVYARIAGSGLQRRLRAVR
jgi:hypothetical protein